MNRYFILFVFSFFMVSAMGQQSKPVIFREEVFDFGAVKEEGGPVTHEFVFTNATTRVIKVLDVQASCGCTTPAWTRDPVQPGKTGFVQASYNPKGRPGYFNKTLTVTTDADPNPIILQIKGNVSAEGPESDADFQIANGSWKLKTGSFNMGKVVIKDEPTVRDFQFINSANKAVTVLKVESPSYIKVEVLPTTIPAGGKGHIKIAYNGKTKNAYGFQTDNVEVHTDDAATPVKSFTVYATLEEHFGELKPEELAKAPKLQLSASSMEFGRVGKNNSATRELTITNTGKKDLAIRSIQPNCTCVTATAAKNTLKPNESTTVKITFDSRDRKATQQKAITFYTNDPQNPVQRFTFTAYVED